MVDLVTSFPVYGCPEELLIGRHGAAARGSAAFPQPADMAGFPAKTLSDTL